MAEARKRKRRVAWPVVVQLLGGAGALGGVYLMLGLPWTLLIGGTVVLVVGMLRESGHV